MQKTLYGSIIGYAAIPGGVAQFIQWTLDPALNYSLQIFNGTTWTDVFPFTGLANWNASFQSPNGVAQRIVQH